MRKDEQEAQKSYNYMAELYHFHRTERFPNGWFFNEMLEMPATLSLLGNIKRKKLLDFGCGTGIYAKILTKKGAIVKGFDISPEMIKIAKKDNPKLDLKVGSGYKIPFSEKFDVVLASLVVDYFEDWNKVFSEVNRMLNKGGIFVFSFGNPVAECSKKIKINGKKVPVLGIRSYFDEQTFYALWGKEYFKENGKKPVKVPSNHKTYETIIRVILNNGFEIIGYKDCFPTSKSKRYFPEYYKSCSRIPYFSVFKVRKK
jgi:SAM-dependent methyltransferase